MEKTLNLVKMKGLLGPEVMANFEPVIVIKQESNENLASFYDVEDLMESPSNPTDFISHVEPEVHSNSGIGNLVSVNNVPYERTKNNFGKFTQVECNMDTSVSVTHSEQVNQVVCNSAWYPNLEFQLDCDLDPIYDELMNSKVAKSSVDYESVKLQFLSEPSDVNKIIHEDLVKQEPLEICFPNSETNKVDYCAVKGSDVENVRTEISDCCLTEVSKTCYVGKGRPSKTNCLTIKVNTRKNLSRDRLYSQVSDFEKEKLSRRCLRTYTRKRKAEPQSKILPAISKTHSLDMTDPFQLPHTDLQDTHKIKLPFEEGELDVSDTEENKPIQSCNAGSPEKALIRRPRVRQCEYCGKVFSASMFIQFKRHLSNHTGEKPFQCTKCGKKYCTEGDLRRHIKNATHDNPSQKKPCGTCGKLITNVNHHYRRVHLDIRNYPCIICGKRFKTGTKLQDHLGSIHDGEAQYWCHFCGKRYTQACNLQYHLRTHSKNQKPFKCTECEKNFTSKYTLINHMKIHADCIPAVCNKCGWGFVSSQELNKHSCNSTLLLLDRVIKKMEL